MGTRSFEISYFCIPRLTPNEFFSFRSREYWHKFIIEGGGKFEMDLVLQAVLDSIYPFDLVPVKYTVEGENSYFLSRNCGFAIEKFCSNLLKPIKVQNGKVVLRIIICYMPIEKLKLNMLYCLKKAIKRRCDSNKEGVIDLSLFHKDPELSEILFCPLSRPRFLKYVLITLRRIMTVKEIKLSYNGIESLEPFAAMEEFNELISLDLSKNKIKDCKCIEVIGKAAPKLTKINLSYNPIHENFESELEYTKFIYSKIPNIKVVDGLTLNLGIPSQRVFLCDYNAKNVVDPFLRHYFTLYDEERGALEHTYDHKAIFTMTTDLMSSLNVADSKLECYFRNTRNLLRTTSKSKKIFLNNQAIARMLCRLPLTKHDPRSFKIDVIHYQELSIVMKVSGLFMDLQDGVTNIRSFTRTFCLKKVKEREYKLKNDLFHVSNPTEEEKKGSWLYQGEKCEKKPSVNQADEDQMVSQLAELTEMNLAHSRRCLEKCGWDMKKALKAFLVNYENSKILPDAS